MHNEVNKSLGKQLFDCSNIGDFYDCGCADDEGGGEAKEEGEGGEKKKKGGKGKGEKEGEGEGRIDLRIQREG